MMRCLWKRRNVFIATLILSLCDLVCGKDADIQTQHRDEGRSNSPSSNEVWETTRTVVAVGSLCAIMFLVSLGACAKNCCTRSRDSTPEAEENPPEEANTWL
ncbi:hypothetical protein V1264_012712 [Littorina saxatilis]|uniref:Uncharacterized protein n=1 Tax=Littorina saxatilis TaxID=31220 RepID=A0AAN9BXU0_9CAEN